VIDSFPRRGEVWFAELNPTRGHEQRGTRPVLVLSVDSFNSGPAELVTVLPVTSTVRPIPSHVEVQAPEGGLVSRSAILADQVRTIARERLVRRASAVSGTTLRRVEEVVRFLLGL
jgi:mRNA interferase MazF